MQAECQLSTAHTDVVQIQPLQLCSTIFKAEYVALSQLYVRRVSGGLQSSAVES